MHVPISSHWSEEWFKKGICGSVGPHCSCGRSYAVVFLSLTSVPVFSRPGLWSLACEHRLPPTVPGSCRCFPAWPFAGWPGLAFQNHSQTPAARCQMTWSIFSEMQIFHACDLQCQEQPRNLEWPLNWNPAEASVCGWVSQLWRLISIS